MAVGGNSEQMDLPMIVSVDDHVVEPKELWQNWLPERHWPDKHDLAMCRTRVRGPGSVRFIPRRGAHIITKVHRPAPAKPVWTVVLVGRDHDDWGFWTPDGYVPYQDYLNRWPVAAGDPQLPARGRKEHSPS